MAQEQETPQPGPSRKRSWSEHPTLRFLLFFFVLFGLYWSYGYLTGPTRITERLQARLDQNPAEVDIAITTKFPPEEFHISIFQRLGSMRGVKGNTAAIHTITPSSVRFLSQYYWVEIIDLIPPKK